jgi:hypothetical protein
MLKKFQKTLSIGLSGLLTLSIIATDATAQRAPGVLHEMVPHVVLPETIQYSKTAKNMPGMGYFGVNSPYVATYVAYPSYQVPYTTTFRPIGQVVYPVSPPLLPAPLPKEQPESDIAIENEELVLREPEGRDVTLSHRITEPIQQAADMEEMIPVLPSPNSEIAQTGVFCQQPAKPPSAWSFSSPVFKVASVPAGWGGQQMGSIVHTGPKGSQQQVGFMPAGGVPGEAGMMQQGVPFSTFQMGHRAGPYAQIQTQVLPNGMIMLMMPPDHSNCGLLRCRTGSGPRPVLLPPGPHGMMPPPGMPMPPAMSAPAPAMQDAMIQGGFGMPYMQVQMQQQMMPQMQTVPVSAMTPMGPVIVGYQQVPTMNTMAMNPMGIMNPQMQMAMPNPMVAQQAAPSGEAIEGTLQPPAQVGAPNQMAVVATPFGYAIQMPAEVLQTDAATQLAQMQQAIAQSQMQMNPYAAQFSMPFAYIPTNQMQGQFGGMPMMNAGFHPMGMMPQQNGLSMSDVLQLMILMNNNNNKQRRPGLFERVAERREARRANSNHNDPFAQLMQAWTTPYTSPDMTLRMPAGNAYPYGYFGAQALPTSTANYGGYHNLYYGNTNYPGLY